MTFQNGPSKSFVGALSSILPYACGLPFNPVFRQVLMDLVKF